MNSQMDPAILDVCPTFSFTNDNTTCTNEHYKAAVEPSHSQSIVDQFCRPSVFLWAVVPLYIFYAMLQGKYHTQAGSVGLIKKCLTMFLTTLTIIHVTKQGDEWAYLSDGKDESYLNWIQISAIILIAVMVQVETSRSWVASTPRSLFWLLMLTRSLINVYNSILEKVYTEDMSGFILSITYLLGIVAHLVLLFVGNGIEEQQAPATVEPVHPEEASSFIGNLFLNWVTGFVRKGYSQELQEEDVPALCKQDKCLAVYPRFGHAWTQEKQRCDDLNKSEKIQKETVKENLTQGTDSCSSKVTVKKKEPSLIRAMFTAYGFQYIAIQTCKCLFDLSSFLQPLLLEALMKYVENRQTEPVWKGYAIVATMFLVNISEDTLQLRFDLARHRLLLHMKTAVRMTVFRKAMTATNESKQDKTVGELVTLINNDVDKLINCTYTMNYIVNAPLQVTIALYMLYSHIGMGAFVGLVIILCFIPINSWVGKKVHALEEEKSDIEDERIKAMNEILNGIKVLKLYAWEKSFIEKVEEIRKREVALFKKITFCNAFMDIMYRCMPLMVRLSGFIVFIILGGYLDPTKAFVASSLFSILSSPFRMLTFIVPQFVKAIVAIKRLNGFLAKSDIREDIVVTDSKADSAVHIEKATFTWNTSAEKATLSNINLKIKKGELVAVVGVVGAGKSSLLSTILGEMEKLDGQVTVQSKLAYVSQEAWILNATLRDNILFGSELESKRYHQVVSACALKEDLKILTAGDRTEIGEKGINLSGGQKQRVSLARAVYSNADIFLLDDPLSAVDAHVGKHIFNKVIGHNGLLQNKTRILVTHGVHWLPFVDNIIVMKEGQISECGTYKQLLSHNGEFAQFLKEVFANDNEDDDSEVQQIKKNIYTRLSSLTEGEVQIESDVLDAELNCSIDKAQDISTFSNESGPVDNDDEIDEEEDKRNRENEEAGKIIEDEETKKSSVSLKVYKEYISAVGYKSILLFSIIFSTMLLSRDLKDVWLGKWTEDPLLANTSLMNTTEYQHTSWMYITVYSLLGGIEVFTAFIFLIVLKRRTHEAANQLHNLLLTNVLRMPMSFFDTTPTGRIITRFSKDVGVVDNIGGCLEDYIRCLGNIIINLFLVMFLSARLIFFIILGSIFFMYLQRLYIRSARQLRRWRSKHWSPIAGCIKETLSGTATVRAYKVQDQFFTKLESQIEMYAKFDWMSKYVSRWSALRIAFLSQFMALAAGISILWDMSISPSMAGLLLAYSTGFVQCLEWFVYLSTYTEEDLVSLERLMEYISKPTEASWRIPELAPPAQWPQTGEIAMDDFKIRYREGLDLVLKGVTFNIRSGEKIGIVGRTGAGKSSLTVALFRLVEAASGQIVLDNHQISSMGLHDLRTKITILPQDPVIFGGSLRMNLDPFNEKTTDELWEALKHSHLQTFVEGLPDKLDYDCGEGGRNLSGGQRQLVCLARTLLRKTKVLVLDEATAAVDMETDDLIQKTICSEFKDCTVLTIAHRLNTIMDYDRVLVMDQGLVKEFDSPKTLLADTTSMFYSLAKNA